MRLTRRHLLASTSFLLAGSGQFTPAYGQAATPRASQVSQADSLVDHIGVCVHLSYSRTPYGNFDGLVRPRIREAGIRHLRDGALTGGSYGPNHEYYRRMRTLADDGIRFSLVVPDDNFPSIAVSPAKLKDVYDWSGHSVAFFEGANEVNLLRNQTWPQVTRRCQQAMYETIKGDPTLSKVGVLGPGLAGTGGAPRMLGDISAYVDFANWHTYSGGRPPENRSGPGSLSSFLKDAGFVYPGRDLVITETGYHSALKVPAGKHPPTPEPVVARYLPRLLLWNFRENIRRTYLYELVDTHVPNDADPEANFGLLRQDGTPKPSYFALKNLIALFSDPGKDFQPQQLKLTIGGGTTDLQTVAFQKRSGNFLVALWLGISAWDSEGRRDLPTPPQSIKLSFGRPVSIIAYHRFGDDGGIQREDTRSTVDTVALTATDRLMVVELRIPDSDR